MNKYRAKKTTVDGITFDSKREADYYCDLLLRQGAGEIERIELQPEFILQDAFTDSMGKKHRAIKYRADFAIVYGPYRSEVVDVKGFKTKEYQIKKKLFLYKYPEHYFREA